MLGRVELFLGLPTTLGLGKASIPERELVWRVANGRGVPDVPAETCRPSGRRAGRAPSLSRVRFPVMEGTSTPAFVPVEPAVPRAASPGRVLVRANGAVVLWENL